MKSSWRVCVDRMGLPPATKLLTVLKKSAVQEAPDGLLRTRQATYEATKKMVASLEDKYTEFLPPSQVSQHPPFRHARCRSVLSSVLSDADSIVTCAVQEGSAAPQPSRA